MWHQLKNNITQQGTYGSIPGESTHDAMFLRQFAFNIHNFNHHPLILIDNDAKSCYDRIIPALAALLLLVTGLSSLVAQSFYQQLQKRQAKVLTGMGISESAISSTDEIPLYGIGQGNGGGPAAWHSHLLIMIATLKKLHPGYTVTDPTKSLTVSQHLITFVDDTSSILTSSPSQIPQLVQSADQLLNTWYTLLRLTGGDLALADKTKWCLAYYEYPKGKPTHVLTTQDEYKLTIKYKQEPHTSVCRILPTKAERYLGIRIAVDGNMNEEFEQRMIDAKGYATLITHSNLTRQEAWISYKVIWTPKINYCLPHTTFSYQQCKRIQSQVLQATLPKIGLNRNFPRAVVFGPCRYGGIQLPNLYVEQGMQHITWLLYLQRQPRTTTYLLDILIRHSQLEAGLGESILETKHDLQYITPTWLTHTIKFIQEAGLTIQLTTKWYPPL